MEMTMNTMSFEEMVLVDGGAWCWKSFSQSIVSGAVGGAIAGSCGGTVTIPGVGTVAGWAGGGLLGALGGAASYLVCGWW